MLEREGNYIDGMILGRNNKLQRVLMPEETFDRINYAGGLEKMRGERITLIPINAKSIIPIRDILITIDVSEVELCNN